MGKWTWEGIDDKGKKVAGSISASSKKEVRNLLRGRSIRLRKITPPSLLEFDISEWLTNKGLIKSHTPKELMMFTRQFSTMISAGIPIMQALEVLFKSQKNPVFKTSVRKVASDVREGKTLNESMKTQKCFDKLYCGLVKAGEAGGILDQILTKLADFLERKEKLKSQIKSAMSYPIIVTCLGFCVIWGMMVFVVPQFVSMIKETGQEVPLLTSYVISISNFMESYYLHTLLSAFFLVLIFRSYIQSEEGNIAFDRFMMKMPLFGDVIIKGNLATFTRTLSTLLSAGVPLIDSLDICIETVSNNIITNDLKKVRRDVEQGKNLTEPLLKITYFPDIITQMIRVGEETGRIDNMLEKISIILEDEVSFLLSHLTKLMEPIIIIVLGGMIAFILVAMYLPMFMAAGGEA